jgi:hypothetical protein
MADISPQEADSRFDPERSSKRKFRCDAQGDSFTKMTDMIDRHLRHSMGTRSSSACIPRP